MSMRISSGEGWVATGLDHVVARLRGRHEPDELAVLLDLDAPRGGAARHDAQAAPEREHQVVVVRGTGRRHLGQLDRPVADLDAGVLTGAADADAQGRSRVQQRVGDELGDTQLGALDEVAAGDVMAGADHPAACILHAAGTRAQGQGWPVQRHGGLHEERRLAAKPLSARVPRDIHAKHPSRRVLRAVQTGFRDRIDGGSSLCSRRRPPIAPGRAYGGTMRVGESVLLARSDSLMKGP
jgi:hypothetical protein